jgi:hypothetical protein
MEGFGRDLSHVAAAVRARPAPRKSARAICHVPLAGKFARSERGTWRFLSGSRLNASELPSLVAVQQCLQIATVAVAPLRRVRKFSRLVTCHQRQRVVTDPPCRLSRESVPSLLRYGLPREAQAIGRVSPVTLGGRGAG